jgi:nucleotide-binding universal stress UspA family protein
MARIVSTAGPSCHVESPRHLASARPVTSALVGPIICAVDDSEGARAAMKVARDLATRLDTALVLVHAEPPTTVPGVSAATAGQERLRDAERVDAQKLLAWLAEEEELGDVELRAGIGDAAETIVGAAVDLEADLVVIGSHGRRALRSAALGSVSHAVATSAPCPVVIVPPTARA